jgi:TPR repeat protein
LNQTDFTWVVEAAADGIAECAFLLGFMHEHGLYVKQSNKTAAEFYKEAAEKGLGAAHYALAMLYDFGRGLEKSPTQAYCHALLAAKKGLPAAQLWVSEAMRQGIGTCPDAIEGRKWLEKAVASGSSEAKMIQAITLIEGGASSQDKNTAHRYLNDLAKEDNEGALLMLSSALHLGEGCEKDEQRALQLLHRAAELGSKHAALRLGLIYGKGLMGVMQDRQKSDYYFELASR